MGAFFTGGSFAGGGSSLRGSSFSGASIMRERRCEPRAVTSDETPDDLL